MRLGRIFFLALIIGRPLRSLLEIFHVTISLFERIVDRRINEGIVFPIPRPRASSWNSRIFDEAPVHDSLVAYAKVVSDSGG